MSALEESILSPISADDPCGPNLEYDAAFVALERATHGKPEQQIGSTIVPAEPPNWREVEGQAAALLGRSKDLRAACGLAIALLQNGGLPGFADGLVALRGLLERYWEGIHPRLDPDDDRDPTMRVNVLAGLADAGVLAAIRTTPMVISRAVGRFSLKDLELASGDAAAPAGAEAPAMATIEAAALDCDLAGLEASTRGARACVDALKAIDAFVAEQVGSEHAPDLSKTKGMLQKIAAFLETALAKRHPAGVSDAAEDGGVEGHTNGAGSAQRHTGEIRSRDDVIRALDKICAYYARFEPSSPVPMFMERCKRLVSKSFIDIVRDLVPDAISHVEVLRGPE